MSDAVLTPFTANDGENLALYEWPFLDSQLEETSAPRAVVLIVHGLGEHAGRYEHVALRLREWGYSVRAYDQRGHGESGGVRGGLPHSELLLEDLAEVVDETRLRALRLTQPDALSGAEKSSGQPPLILLGHSLGGLVAGRFVSLAMRRVDGLVMSSPVLDPGLNPIQKLLLATLPSIAPNLRLNNGLKPQYLSRDRQVVEKYLADPLVHEKISARLAKFIATAGPATVAAAADWRTPTLLMWAGADKLVNPAGSQAFTQLADRHGKTGLVTTRCFDELYHEIFNELDAGPVFDGLKSWLDTRF
jgi:alpha-beta hydrolase superfamily lysophospholipase